MAWDFTKRKNKYLVDDTEVSLRLETSTQKLTPTEIKKIIVETEVWVNGKCGSSGWGDLVSKDLDTLTDTEIMVITVTRWLAIKACLHVASTKLEKSLVFKSQAVEIDKAQSMNNVLRSIFEENAMIRELIQIIKDSTLASQIKPCTITAPAEDARKWSDST